MGDAGGGAVTVHVVPVGDHTPEAITVGGPRVVGVGIPRPALGDLTDVDGTVEAPVDVPLAWRKDQDGTFRPEPAPTGGGDPGDVQNLIDTALGGHVQDDEPHPAYDDLPSLRLLFENGLI